MLRFLDRANFVTLVGLLAALASSLLSVSGQPAKAVCALVAAGLCDLFDGLLARRLARDAQQREFGGHLDSLVDACSFGMAPALLLYAVGMRSWPELALVAVFLCSGVWRLAYFETTGFAEGEARKYHGLPTTFVALVVPVALCAGYAGPTELRVAANVAAGLLAVAMVSPIPIPKPGGAWYAVLLLVAIALLVLYGGYPGVWLRAAGVG